MSFDLTAAANILKVRYLGPIREQLNNSTILLKRLQREGGYVDVSGKTFTVPLHTTRNSSAGSGRADMGALPTAGQQGYAVAVIPNAYQYGRIQVSGRAPSGRFLPGPPRGRRTPLGESRGTTDLPAYCA